MTRHDPLHRRHGSMHGASERGCTVRSALPDRVIPIGPADPVAAHARLTPVMRGKGWMGWVVVVTLGWGDNAWAAPPEAAPVEDWGPEDEVAPAPTPAPAPVVAATPEPAPVVAPKPVPPPTPEELELRRQRKGAEATAITGYVFVGLGATALVLLAMPAAIAAGVARDRAEGDPILVSQTELEDRADRRARFAKISALAGLGGLAVGGALVVAGLVRRNRLDRELQRLGAQRVQADLSPWLSRDTAGVALTGRF